MPLNLNKCYGMLNHVLALVPLRKLSTFQMASVPLKFKKQNLRPALQRFQLYTSLIILCDFLMNRLYNSKALNQIYKMDVSLSRLNLILSFSFVLNNL